MDSSLAINGNTDLSIYPSYFYASNYYEAMLRYWSSAQAIYILTTQVQLVTPDIAVEVNKQTYDLTIASLDASNEWVKFMDSLTYTSVINFPIYPNYNIVIITVLFDDGLMITGSVELESLHNQEFPTGGLPKGTTVIVNYYSQTI